MAGRIWLTLFVSSMMVAFTLSILGLYVGVFVPERARGRGGFRV